MSKSLLLTVLAVMISTAHSFGQEPADDVDWKRYSYVLQSSTLEWLPSQPFFLKADYQLYDLEGHPTVKGTVDETWPASKSRQIQIHSPSLTVEEPQSDEERAHSREDYLVRQALSSIVRPFPSATPHNEFRLEVAQNIAKVQFHCFSIVPPRITSTAINLSYCTNDDNQIVAITGPEFVVDREDFRRFRGHEVPMTVNLSYQVSRKTFALVARDRTGRVTACNFSIDYRYKEVLKLPNTYTC